MHCSNLFHCIFVQTINRIQWLLSVCIMNSKLYHCIFLSLHKNPLESPTAKPDQHKESLGGGDSSFYRWRIASFFQKCSISQKLNKDDFFKSLLLQYHCATFNISYLAQTNVGLRRYKVLQLKDPSFLKKVIQMLHVQLDNHPLTCR